MKHHHTRDPYGDRHKFSRYQRTNPLLDLYRAYLPLWADYIVIPLLIAGLYAVYYYDKRH